jgi:hypothetical protein
MFIGLCKSTQQSAYWLDLIRASRHGLGNLPMVPAFLLVAGATERNA